MNETIIKQMYDLRITLGILLSRGIENRRLENELNDLEIDFPHECAEVERRLNESYISK